MQVSISAFDALACFDRLKAAGVSEALARIQAEILREHSELCAREIRQAIEKYDESKRVELATKVDVQDVRLEVEKVRAEVEKVRGKVEKVRAEVERTKFDLLKWQLAGWVTLAAIMAKGFNWLGF